MPTYQYTCTECATPLEAVQSFSDAALTTCPTCGGRLRKVFSAVGVVFKGSGFYRNDSRDGAKAKASPVNGDAGAGTGSDSAAAKTSDKTAEKSSDKATAEKSSSTSSTPDKAKAATAGSSERSGSASKKPSTGSSSGSSAA